MTGCSIAHGKTCRTGKNGTRRVRPNCHSR